jgi:hypothetical protein
MPPPGQCLLHSEVNSELGTARAQKPRMLYLIPMRNAIECLEDVTFARLIGEQQIAAIDFSMLE